MKTISWESTKSVRPETFTCFNCGSETGTNVGYKGTYREENSLAACQISICPICTAPTFFPPEHGAPIPQGLPGRAVEKLPVEIGQLYDEGRKALGAGAPTAAAMAFRKILMNMAVDEGAEKNESFAYYVDWLDKKGHVPPKGKKWVDQVRKDGNEATHEIHMVSAADATISLNRTTSLLHFNYEMRDEDDEADG